MTYAIRKSRSAIRSVCKLYDIDLDTEDRIAKLIPQSVFEETEDGSEKKTDLSIKESLEIVPELREYQEIYPEVFEMAMKLEGLPSHTGIHAAGTLITDTPVANFAPMIKQDKKELNAIGLDLHDAERQKAVKFDYLAINNLNVIKECQNLTNDIFDQEFNNYDDPDIWKLIGSSNTIGLFQIGSKTYKRRMPRLKPKTINELADCLALVRGPCIQSNLDEKYMQIREGRQKIELIHPLYDSVTQDTNGILIYQEQMMQVCNNMGLPLYDCYVLMKACAKKKHNKVAKYKERLYETAKDLMDKQTFEKIFKLVLDSAKYSFNRSHALAYAMLCYTTAYYKCYHTKEFFAATFTCMYTNKSGKTDERWKKLMTMYTECKRFGIKFLPLDINKSSWKFTIENEEIRLGYCGLTSFSYKAYLEIQNCLPFDDNKSIMQQVYDTTDKRACSSKAINPLILSGAFGSNTIELYEEYFRLNSKKKNEEPTYEVFIHKQLTIEVYDSDENIESQLFGVNFIHNNTKNLEPINLSNRKTYAPVNGQAIVTKITKRKYDKNKKRMAILLLDTTEGLIEAVVFDNNYKEIMKGLKKNNKIELQGKISKNDTIIINNLSII